MNDQALRSYYEFDDDDLNANRSGRLTEKQLDRLKQRNQFMKIHGKRAGWYFFGLAAILPLCMVPVGFLSLFVFKDLPHALEGWGLPPVGAYIWRHCYFSTQCGQYKIPGFAQKCQGAGQNKRI